MKVGVIGAGYWGKKHVDEYTKLGHEVFVSDLSKENLDFCKLNFGARPVSNYDEILNDKTIENISICTPNSTHYQMGLEALNAGKNILLEKPLATNTKDADELIKTSIEKNVILLVGHIFRFNNAINKVKELIRNKNLGQLYTVNICWTNLELLWPDRDILFDLGVHPLDIIDNIFEKKPLGIFCVGEGFRQENPEFAIINFHLKDSSSKPLFVNIDLSWLNPIRNRRVIIVGSEKTVIVDCTIQKIKLINNQSGVEEEIPIEPNNTIRDELNFFLTNSENKEKINEPAPNGEVAKRIIETIEEAQKSLKTNLT